MADMMNTLRALLGDNADEKIQNAMNMLKSSGLVSEGQNVSSQSTMNNLAQQINNDIKVEKKEMPSQKQQNNTNNNANFGNMQNVLTPEGLEFLGQIRGMVNQMSNTNDNRSELLRSLRPFMRTPRQQTIDRAIRIMNIGRFSGLFGR